MRVSKEWKKSKEKYNICVRIREVKQRRNLEDEKMGRKEKTDGEENEIIRQ